MTTSQVKKIILENRRIVGKACGDVLSDLEKPNLKSLKQIVQNVKKHLNENLKELKVNFPENESIFQRS